MSQGFRPYTRVSDVDGCSRILGLDLCSENIVAYVICLKSTEKSDFFFTQINYETCFKRKGEVCFPGRSSCITPCTKDASNLNGPGLLSFSA